MQPTFMPWIGYFDMIDQADSFVLYDDVQLAKRSWQVRNRIKTPNGELYLNLPVKKTKHRDDLLICEAELSYDEKWVDKHLKSIEGSYRKAAHFDSVFPFIAQHYEKKYTLLSDFNANFITGVSAKIGIDTTILRATEIPGVSGVKDYRLTDICNKISCREYLSPQGSAAYIEAERPGGELANQGIQLYYHFYKHPVYQQGYGDFLPYMGITDLLMNEGFENSLSIIRSGRMPKMDYSEYRKQHLNLNDNA
jgi:hypothetical protein